MLKGKAQQTLHGWDSVYSELLKLLTGSLATLYERYDSYLNAVLATSEAPIQCRPACPSCCSHYPTSIEPFELLGLHTVLRTRENYPEIMFSLHERTQVFRKGFKSEEGEEAEDKALYRYFLRNKPCPLLTAEGSCGVRENRPMSCRMYFSLSAPSTCKGKAIATVGNQNFIVELPDEAEIALAEASEFLSDLELSQHFYDGLLQVNEHFGKHDGP